MRNIKLLDSANPPEMTASLCTAVARVRETIDPDGDRVCGADSG